MPGSDLIADAGTPGADAGTSGADAGAPGAYAGLSALPGLAVPATALPIADTGSTYAAALSDGPVAAQSSDVSAAATLATIASDPATGLLLAAGLTLPAAAAFLRRRHRRRIAWGRVERRDTAGRSWNWV